MHQVQATSCPKREVNIRDNGCYFLPSHQNVAFYCECHLIRKHVDTGKGKFGAAKTKVATPYCMLRFKFVTKFSWDVHLFY